MALSHFPESRRQGAPFVPAEAQAQEEQCLAAVVGMRWVEEVIYDLLLLDYRELHVGQPHFLASSTILISSAVRP